MPFIKHLSTSIIDRVNGSFATTQPYPTSLRLSSDNFHPRGGGTFNPTFHLTGGASLPSPSPYFPVLIWSPIESVRVCVDVGCRLRRCLVYVCATHNALHTLATCKPQVHPGCCGALLYNLYAVGGRHILLVWSVPNFRKRTE